jgi:hypothetical protein
LDIGDRTVDTHSIDVTTGKLVTWRIAVTSRGG